MEQNQKAFHSTEAVLWTFIGLTVGPWLLFLIPPIWLQVSLVSSLGMIGAMTAGVGLYGLIRYRRWSVAIPAVLATALGIGACAQFVQYVMSRDVRHEWAENR